MNVTFDKTDELNGRITIAVEKADYAENVEKGLKDFRKKANMPGFRPGQVPMGLLKKRFGAEIKAEQVDKLLREKLYAYIRENNLNILGEPLPNEDQQQSIDFETQDDFSFVFDVALAPEIKAKLTKKDKVNFYTIDVDDEMVDKQVQMYASRGGQYVKVDQYEPKDMVKGLLVELDKKGNPVEGGVQVEGAVMLPDYMKNKTEKAKFDGAKVNDVLTFNPSKAYGGSETELASLLHLKKEEVADKKGNFSFQVEEITRYEAAAIDQALFDKVLGEGKVKNEKEFRAAIKDMLAAQLVNESEFKFMQDLRAHLMKRVGKVEFPDAMLKRIMRLNNPDKDEKFVEDNYEKSLEELTWQLIKEQLTEQFEVKLTQEDVQEAAKAVTKMQFAQYGMMDVPDEVLTNYANEMLKNKQQADGLVTRAIENKIAAAAKEAVKLEEKTVSLDEFNKMFEKK
ncbi:MAG: trigger factor [Bacteroidaceae bacterium]|nr:trigger factor [Bacteroidaceae bacterium]